jgi:hypothetical protein
MLRVGLLSTTPPSLIILSNPLFTVDGCAPFHLTQKDRYDPDEAGPEGLVYPVRADERSKRHTPDRAQPAATDQSPPLPVPNPPPPSAPPRGRDLFRNHRAGPLSTPAGDPPGARHSRDR